MHRLSWALVCITMTLRTGAVAICSVAAAALLWNCDMDGDTWRRNRPENGRGVKGAHWIQLYHAAVARDRRAAYHGHLCALQWH